MTCRRGSPDPLAPAARLALERIARAAALDAGRALSTLCGVPVTLTVLPIRNERIDRIADPAGGPDAAVVGVRLGIEGAIGGALLVTLDPGSASGLVGRLLPARYVSPAGAALRESALLEAGNILAGAWLGAMARALGSAVTMSVPELARDMAGALLDGVLAETYQGAESALLVRASIEAAGAGASGTLFLLPDPHSLPAALGLLTEGEGTARG